MAINLQLASPVVYALGRSGVLIHEIWVGIKKEFEEKGYLPVVDDFKHRVYLYSPTSGHVRYDHGMIDITLKRNKRWVTYFIDHTTVYRQAKEEEKVFLAYPQWRSALSHDIQ